MSVNVPILDLSQPALSRSVLPALDSVPSIALGNTQDLGQLSQTILPSSLSPIPLASESTDVGCCYSFPVSTQLAQVVIGQQFDQDVLGDIAKGWNNFVETGQIWALGIGIVLGYLFKSITSSH